MDDRSNGGKPFFFLYQAVFKRIGLRLPFTTFERELLTEVNVAPAQLHPNGWAFVRAFQILCRHLSIPPSVDVFLHFFEVKKQGKSLWVSFSGVASRILLTLFQNSFKGWKGNFFRVCCAKHDPAALDGFPLYWTKKPNPTTPRHLYLVNLRPTPFLHILVGSLALCLSSSYLILSRAFSNYRKQCLSSLISTRVVAL